MTAPLIYLIAWPPRLLGVGATLFHVAHQLGPIRPLNAALFVLAEGFGVQVMAALFFRFVFFNLDAVLVRPCVLANAGHLPRYFHSRRAGADREAIALHLFGN